MDIVILQADQLQDSRAHISVIGPGVAIDSTPIDPMAHVNNAAMWSPAEEHLSAEGVVALTGAEIEYRAPIGSEEAVTLHSLYEPGTLWCWLTVDGTTRASLRVEFAQS